MSSQSSHTHHVPLPQRPRRRRKVRKNHDGDPEDPPTSAAGAVTGGGTAARAEGGGEAGLGGDGADGAAAASVGSRRHPRRPSSAVFSHVNEAVAARGGLLQASMSQASLSQMEAAVVLRNQRVVDTAAGGNGSSSGSSASKDGAAYTAGGASDGGGGGGGGGLYLGEAEGRDYGTHGFEYLDHTADVQLHSWGETMAQALEGQVVAMFGYMTDLRCVAEDPSKSQEVAVEAPDMLGLIYRLLHEFLCLFAIDDLVCCGFF